MTLYFLRHADAEDPVTTDAARNLTIKGIGQANKVATFCSRQKIKPDLVLFSPLVRAEQTAAIVAKALEVNAECCRWLACGMTPQIAVDHLRDYSHLACVLLVGHEPDFSTTISYLLGTSGASAVLVRKASLIAITLHALREGAGMLDFSISNRFLSES